MGITDNMRVDPRHHGLTGLLSPGNCHVSGGRADLFAKNISQTRIPNKGGDLPDMFTGYESIFGDYTFDSTKRDNEVRVIEIIDKYASKISSIRAGSNPMQTVIYRDMKTGEVSYFDIRRFTHFTNDYGYENIQRNIVRKGDTISPDMEIYSSPAKDGDLYKLGVNANVAYFTMLEGTEDCFAMSASMAKRLAPKSIEVKSINVNMKRYPLNLYGDDDNYRIFPDIGDTVNSDGILCAFRPVRKFSAMSDLRPEKLTTVQHLFDQKVYAHPGAKVVDIEIYMDSRSDLPARVYEQIKIYYEARLQYWRQIVEEYEKVKHLQISHKFNTLVTRAMGRLLAAKQSVPGVGKRPKTILVDKFNPVSLRIDITLAHEVIVNKGHKSAGRDGAKGVLIIVPDDEMPVDEQGFRADVVIDPISVLKRTNIIQLYEQYVNRVLKWQAMHLDELGSIQNQFNRIVEVLNDINPEYAKIIVQQHPDLKLKTHYVEMCKADTIKICCPPSMDNMTADMIKLLEKKYQTPISPVTFTIVTSTGKKKVTTKDPVCIGKKYIYLLSKYPKPLAPGYGFVNKVHLPVNSKDKNGSPLGTTPIRFGESESRIFAAAIEIPTILRLKSLYSGSRMGPKMMIGALMDAPVPSQLSRVDIDTETLYNDNPAVRIAHHMMETCGLDIQNSVLNDVEAEGIYDYLSKLEK